MAAQENRAAPGRSDSGDHVGALRACADRLDLHDAELAELVDDECSDGALVAGRVRARRRDESAREADQLLLPLGEEAKERRLGLDRRGSSARHRRCEKVSIARAIRIIPSSISSGSRASEMRTRPSPPGPKTSPGATATRSSSSRRNVKSLDDRPEAETFTSM